jgi:UDP:flavonoid glycosyltransferase YjiC (YdhE family)
MSSRKIVLATFGSLGDLHPYLALGRELRRRGHDVVLATLNAYRSRVEAQGLTFHALRPEIDPTDPAELRRAMNKRTGGTYILRDLAFGHVRESFEDCRAAARGADVIVTHPVAYGMLLAARASGRPWASVALAPLSLFSASDPAVYPNLPFADAVAGLGSRVQRAILRMIDYATRGWQKTYRALEKELGLPPGPNPVVAGQHSPHLVLALFSPVLAAPQSDWPPATRVTGFPFFAHQDGLSPELTAFLDAGEPPVVFTLGSAAVGVAGDFFIESVTAAQRLGRRALLLVGSDPANQPRASLPPGVLAVPYAPHAAVFPRAAVIVHQGGIGTTGEAMRAGRPMLVVPYNHDQPDHARRLRRLGVARTVPQEKYNAPAAVRELRALLTDEQCAARARAVGEQVRAEDGLHTACDALEALMLTGQARP